MLTFTYNFELKNGYKPVMESEMEKDINIVVRAENRATADRMIKALLNDEIVSWSGCCIEE